MRTLTSFFLACLCLGFAACSISSTKNEQRSVELPKDSPEATLATAENICRELIATGYGADVRAKFPTLSPEQFQGLFLKWNAGVFSQSGKSVFITCGITYADTLPEAKAIADYCEVLVRKSVNRRFFFSSK